MAKKSILIANANARALYKLRRIPGESWVVITQLSITLEHRREHKASMLG